MTNTSRHFSPLARLLHWIMAVLILAMLFVGVAMVATVSHAHATLIALHRPLGVALLVLALIRVAVRLKNGSPALRSEEHTSELQSRRDLVCRLLLEKKKTTSNRE